ncbi:sulfotransferase [Micromonospora auratinigra]|uniref:Sulfotransferase family protein n=1 Tax=Micromonospora auratinigra TaxID=261654 RepID=A0A1A8Z8W7_9ACTN|nr:sulfotransferase [Micromonospora auratinigra]SBT40402.1 Sulfotransferase family protein [Micromonospora auratinigra]
MNGSLTVLSVTGWCRNGSTIIGNVLGEVPGVVHVGELHFLWRNATGRGVNDRCGCGERLTDCPLWSTVLPIGRPDGTTPDAHAAAVIARQRGRLRTRHTWRVLRRGAYDGQVRAHAELMGAVYRAVAARTGARVIVDSTKIPGEAALLPHVPGVTPYWLHLVRDPRAVAHSWREPKEYVYAMSAARSTAYWNGFNRASAAINRRHPQRSMFLRYEDFTADPAGTVDALLRLVGVDPAGNPVRGRGVELRGNHTVTGNPDRFRTGPTLIRDLDDGWRSTLTRRQRLAVTTLAWPLAARYGYRTGHAATSADTPDATSRAGTGR